MMIVVFAVAALYLMAFVNPERNRATRFIASYLSRPARVVRRRVIGESDYAYGISNPLTQADPLGLYSLSIYRRRFSRVADRTQLPPVCLGQNSCTNFPTDQIRATCVCRCVQGDWNMRISVEIAYDMYLASGGPAGDPWHEDHEMLHVNDIVDGLHTYLTGQEAVDFPSQTQCEHNCRRIESSIDAVIGDIARRSRQVRR